MPGIEYNQQLARSNDAHWTPEGRAKRRAANALQAIYGDIAGDPEAARQMQQYGQSEQAFPLEQRGRELRNTGAEQTISQNEQAFPLEQQGRKLQNEGRRLANVGAGQDIQLNREKITDAQMDNRERAMLNGALMLQSAQESGRDVLATYDAITRAAPGLFEDPAHAVQLREGLASGKVQPADIVNAIQSRSAKKSSRWQLVTDADGNVFRVSGDGQAVPVQGVTDVKGAGGQQAVAQGRALGKARGERAGEDLPLSETGKVKAEAALDASKQTFTALDRQLTQTINGATMLSTGPGAVTAFIPGTPAANQAARLKSITGNLINRYVAELKQLSKNGSTGFGSLTELEAERMASQYAALDQAQAPQQFRDEMTYLQNEMRASRARIDKAYRDDQKARGKAPAPATDDDGWSVEEVQ